MRLLGSVHCVVCFSYRCCLPTEVLTRLTRAFALVVLKLRASSSELVAMREGRSLLE